MASDFTGASQLMRKIIIDQTKQPSEKSLQAFELRRDAVNIMKCFKESTPDLLTEEQLRALEYNQTELQTVDLYLYNRRANGTGTVRVREGSGSMAPVTVTPTYFDGIEVGMDMSLANQAIRQASPGDVALGEGERRALIERVYADHLAKNLAEVFREVYDRAEAQYAAYLVANRWTLLTTADAGTIYTTYTGNYKQVPNTDQQEFIQNMAVEAQQNNFEKMGRMPFIIASTKAKKLIMDYAAKGVQQDRNIIQFLGEFEKFDYSNKLVDGAGVAGTYYMIYPGGVGMFNRATNMWASHPRAEADGSVTIGEDTHHPILEIGEGTSIMSDMPKVRLEMHQVTKFDDTSGTYGLNEATLDLVDTWSFYTKFGALRAYDQDAAVSPILGYEIAS